MAPLAFLRFSVRRPKTISLSFVIEIFFRSSSFTNTNTVRRSRSISSTSRCSMFDCLTRAMAASISAGLVFGISSHLPILDRSPSHSRGNNYFDRPLPQSAFDWEDFSADVRLFLKGTPPHRRHLRFFVKLFFIAPSLFKSYLTTRRRHF